MKVENVVENVATIYADKGSSYRKGQVKWEVETYRDYLLNELLEIIIEDVPHQYQDRLLQKIKEITS